MEKDVGIMFGVQYILRQRVPTQNARHKRGTKKMKVAQTLLNQLQNELIHKSTTDSHIRIKTTYRQVVTISAEMML